MPVSRIAQSPFSFLGFLHLVAVAYYLCRLLKLPSLDSRDVQQHRGRWIYSSPREIVLLKVCIPTTQSKRKFLLIDSVDRLGLSEFFVT